MEGFYVFLFIIGMFLLPALPHIMNSFIRSCNIKSSPSKNQLVVRIKDSDITDDDGNLFLTKVIEGKDYFPIDESMNVSFVTHLYDQTGEKRLPVYSLIKDYSKNNSHEFECSKNFGMLTPNHKLVDWSMLGMIPLDFIIPPFSGQRNLVATIEIVPQRQFGQYVPKYNVFAWKKEFSFSYNFTKKGYREIANDHSKGRLLALQLGVAVAWSDGQYEEREENILKIWVADKIKQFSGEQKQKHRQMYYDAIDEVFTKIKNNTLSLSNITQGINRINDLSIKYEAIDLCFKVLAADGKVEREEMTLIKNISDVLDLDIEEVTKIKDREILGLEMSMGSSPDIENLLGIDKNWDNETKRKFLRKEFQKWNNRLSIVSEGSEKDNAQRMLDLIAEARKDYE